MKDPAVPPLSVSFPILYPNTPYSFDHGALLYFFHDCGDLHSKEQIYTGKEQCAYLLPRHTTITIHTAKPFKAALCIWPQLELAHHHIISLMNCPDIGMIMKLLAQETALTAKAQTKDHDQVLIALDMLLRSFCQRHADVPLRFTPRKNVPPDCERVRNYLVNHYPEAITLDQLAKLVHRNKYSLSHLYQATMNCTIMEELKQIRLHQAKTELVKSDAPIKEIAQRCGFTSSAYFIESFRRQYAITPLQYRKKQHQKSSE